MRFFSYLCIMAKDKTAYVCDYCGQESAKWIGKCPSCGQWNTFKEIRIAATPSKGGSSKLLVQQSTTKNKPLRRRASTCTTRS